MPARLTSLWTVEQIVLTAAIVVCCLLLAVVRPRRAGKEAQGHRKGVARRPAAQERFEEDGRRPVRTGNVVLAVVLAAVAVFLLGRADNPVGVRTDSWSDANVIVSGRNYAREGLFAHWGAAQHQVVTEQNPSDPFFIYTQYPVGSNLISGLWHIVGVRSIALQRLLPTTCSLAAVVLWFGLYRRLAGQTVAVVAAIAMTLSYGFLAYADNLHFHAYAFLTSVAAMRCYLRAMGPDEGRRLRWFWLSAVLMFLTAWFTWEYHLWMVLFIAVYAFVFKCPVRRPYLALLAVPLLTALALQVAQQRLALADAHGAAAGEHAPTSCFLEDAYRRTLGFAEAVDTPRGLTLANYPKFLLLRYYKFYGLPAVAALAMLLTLLARDRRAPWKVRDWPDGAKLVVALLVAGTGWWLVMLQHTAVHPHVMRQGLAGYALLMALMWLRCWKTARSAVFPVPARAAAVAVALVLCYPQIEGLICNLRVHYEQQYRDNRQRGTAGFLESRQMSLLSDMVPPGAVILTNDGRLPLMRLWSERPVYRGTSHRYPRGDSHNGRVVAELRFNHLRELYSDNLPPLYYVYRVKAASVEAAFADNGFLRFFLLGDAGGGEDAWEKAAPIVVEAWQSGHSDGSFCPIVTCHADMLVFGLDPAVPGLRRSWGPKGFPTLREFGPPR